MPPRDPLAIQLDFPLLTADLISELRLVGALGLLNFLPEVRPTYIVGSREGALRITTAPVVFKTAETFTGRQTNPAADVVVATTGQLPAGDYDVQCSFSLASSGGNIGFVSFEHRNAANLANLSRWDLAVVSGIRDTIQFSFALELADDERLQVRTGIIITGQISATIMAKRQPTP